MALDREKTFSNAERLLKQGKVALALDECKRLAEDAPRDLLMLNRIGDFLARSNRGADAIVYYEMIARQFSASGFYPKAIAIVKKIVKVDPSRVSAVVQLGELNLKQKLPGEARGWLLQAAEEYLRRREFGNARDVYEKLAIAEPGNIVHVVRLAEARAAEGDVERAGLDLVALGAKLLAGARADEAERTYKRAAELLPNRAEPTIGLARCHHAAGRLDEARRTADEAWARGEHADAVAGDLFLLFEEIGDTERSARLLLDPRSDLIAADAIELAFRQAMAGGGADSLWTRIMPLLDRWARAGHFERSAGLLERVARSEEGGHVRALEQLVEIRKAEGNRGTAARAVERLVRAYQAKGLADRAAPQLETLKLLDPTSPLLFLGRSAVETREAPAPAPAPAGPPQASAAASDVSYEAPAVPLNPADAEFVSGNLTEAEVFEKYGLHREALQQLRQITARFPGHVTAQERLVGFLRTQADRGALRDGLVALALARRAAGDVEGARAAVREAATLGSFDNAIREVLERFSLLQGVAPPTPSRPPVPPPPPAPIVDSGADEVDMEIVFDDADTPVGATGSPASETIEEIEFYLNQGMRQDAILRIAEARAAGLDAARLDALEARAKAGAEETLVEHVEENGPGDGGDRLDEEDLSSITAALEAEYGTDRVPDPAVAPTEPECEQSIDQVFETFKEHVNAAVEVGDFQTHYDLGIAYKEMGLVDAALDEFRIATGEPALYREACSMLGLCHWERGDPGEAIRWYRAALEAPGGEEVPLSGLRYDLADKLEQTGEAQGAYDLFAQIVREEPGYRDATRRAAALRSKLGL